MENNDDYFGFSSFEIDGKVKNKQEFKEYLKEESEKNITCKKKLKIGDIVKLKKVDHIVKIKTIDCMIADMGKVDYEGEKINEPDKGMSYFFNQNDIEKIIEE